LLPILADDFRAGIMKSSFKNFLFGGVCAVSVLACGGGGGSSSPAPAQVTEVDIYSSIDNCSTAAQVPNCAFQQGVYILKIGSNVSDEQQQRVIDQITGMLNRADESIRELFALQRVVIGVIASEPVGGNPEDDFVLALADSLNGNTSPKVLDAVELVYTDLDGIDETLKSTAYQKMMQLFDYYIDQDNNSAPGTELAQAYADFQQELVNNENSGQSPYLTYNPCNYGNLQLADSTCPADPDEDPNGNGTPDPIHQLASDLNPGALFGTVYEYLVDPANNTPAGELSSSDDPDGSNFNDVGVIGSGGYGDIDWSNPAFAPIADYLNKYFLVN
jgi:hypothetical protein